MLISLYVALWITNFAFAASTAAWKVLTILPGIVSALVYVYIVKTAALVLATYSLDEDLVLEIIEQTEGSKQLAVAIREFFYRDCLKWANHKLNSMGYSMLFMSRAVDH
jgi:hypothetical protein